MNRFFVTADKVSDNSIIIDGDDVKHITRVLRLDVGDEIEVCDGEGNDYLCKISSTSPTLTLEILKKEKSKTEPNIEVTLFQGLPKASKIDYIIQKCTELGIFKIVPCNLARCVVKLDGKEENKISRMQKIAVEAAKQSKRGIIPEVCKVHSLVEVVSKLKDFDVAFVPYENEEQTSIKAILTEYSDCGKKLKIGYIIGPEGGFDDKEIELIKKSGIKTVSLGKRILRTETAGEAVLTMIMYELGEI